MKLVQTKDYLLLIDEKVKSKEFDYYLDSTNNVSRRSSNKYGQGFDDVEKMIYCNHIHRNDKVIIAYHPLTKEAKELDLPLLPNPFEEDITKLAIQDLDDGEEGVSNIDIKNWIKGYKVAQSKQFNSNDMILFAEYVGNYYADIHKPVIPTEELLNNFAQSLSTQQSPKEFIPDYQRVRDLDNRDINGDYNSKLVLKTITNSEGKEILVGTYKY